MSEPLSEPDPLSAAQVTAQLADRFRDGHPGLGLWTGGKVVIDGPSGHVLRIPHDPDESGLEGVFLAQDLDHFLTMLTHWITGLRILRRLENSEEAHLLRQHIDDAIWEIDPKGSQAGVWKYSLYNE